MVEFWKTYLAFGDFIYLSSFFFISPLRLCLSVSEIYFDINMSPSHFSLSWKFYRMAKLFIKTIRNGRQPTEKCMRHLLLAAFPMRDCANDLIVFRNRIPSLVSKESENAVSCIWPSKRHLNWAEWKENNHMKYKRKKQPKRNSKRCTISMLVGKKNHFKKWKCW